MYKITQRQKENAKKLGVKIYQSTNPKKKIDVYSKGGIKVASIGATGYKDYDIHLKEKGLAYANERRRLYRIRHQNDRTNVGSAGYYADKILW